MKTSDPCCLLVFQNALVCKSLYNGKNRLPNRLAMGLTEQSNRQNLSMPRTSRFFILNPPGTFAVASPKTLLAYKA